MGFFAFVLLVVGVYKDGRVGEKLCRFCRFRLIFISEIEQFVAVCLFADDSH